MKSMLCQFKKVQTKPLPHILKVMNISEKKLFELFEMWINQGNITPVHPVFKELKKRRDAEIKRKRQEKQELELLKYKELRQRKYSNKQIAKEMHYPYDKLNSFLKKWYNTLRRQGLSNEAIAKELNASKNELTPIILAYEERQRMHEEMRRRRIAENKRYAKTHLKRIREDLKGPSEYFIFDTEAVQCPDELIEIAVIDRKGTTVYNSLVKPSHKINWRISSLTGITNQMVMDKPSIHQVMRDLHDLIAGKTLMSWGIDYDSVLLRKSIDSTGIDLNCKFCCAQKIHMGLVEDINQIALQRAADCDMQNHRALDDCKLVLDVLRKDIEMIDNKSAGFKQRTPAESNGGNTIFIPRSEPLAATP